MNTQLRQEVTNKFEINLYKLMNKSVSGKTCENVKKYTDVKLVTKETEIDMLSQKEGLKRYHIFYENLATVILERRQVKLNTFGKSKTSVFM